ncbi:MAG: molecular chaperone GrpE [Maribacter sp.]|jgi:molecular chaperone GrpE
MKLKNIFNKMGKKEENNQVIEDENVVNNQEQNDTEKTTDNTESTDNQSENATEDGEEAAEIIKLKQELAEAKDKYLRLFAEFDNFRKRTNREKLELRKTAAADTLSALLPVLDDFDRAKKNHDDKDSIEEFSEGVIFVYDKISTFMTKQGLKIMVSTGEDFNSDFHEAITEIPAPTEEMKGKVIDTVENGYILNDKIIRYAKVVVGK